MPSETTWLQETRVRSSHGTFLEANSAEICGQFNKFITLPSVLLSCVFDLSHLLLQISLFPCNSRVSLIAIFSAGDIIGLAMCEQIDIQRSVPD